MKYKNDDVVHALQEEKLNNIQKVLLEVRDAVKAQNGRVRKLENWRNLLTGGFALFVLLVGWGALKVFGG